MHANSQEVAKKLCQKYFFSGIYPMCKQVLNLCGKCIVEKGGKVFEEIKPVLITERGERMGIDISFIMKRIVLSGIDYGLREVDSELIVSKEPKVVVEGLKLILSRKSYSVVNIIHDCGKEWEASFKTYLDEKNITNLKTAPYTPSQNGLVERWHKWMKKGLKSFEGVDTEFKAQLKKTVDTWNNLHIHCALGMTSKDYKNLTDLSNIDQLQTEDRKKKIVTVAQIINHRVSKQKKMCAAAERNKNKRRKKQELSINDMVLIRVPPPYRKFKEDKFTKKGLIVGEKNPQKCYKIRLQETGGWLKSHQPFSEIFIHQNNIKKYVLGIDNILVEFDKDLEEEVNKKPEEEQLNGSPYMYTSFEKEIMEILPSPPDLADELEKTDISDEEYSRTIINAMLKKDLEILCEKNNLSPKGTVNLMKKRLFEYFNI